MNFSPTKSTIFVPKNLQESPKICVDCSAKTANYFSFAYRVYLCVECSNIHDTCLEKYLLGAQRTDNCPLVWDEWTYDENYYFNLEFEEFLPKFFQKMGARTPENFRREYIISKYTHKVFTTASGVNSLIPELIVTLMFKRCKHRATWHPCCVRLDKQDKTLQYYSYKANRLTPKLVIPLTEVDLFMEPLESDTYIHLVWTKQLPNPEQRRTFIKRKVSTCDLDQVSTQVRNFYFRPTTDFELLQLFFSISSAKSALYVPPVPLSNTLKRSFSFNVTLSREGEGEGEELFIPFLPTRQSVCDFLTERTDLIDHTRELSLDPLIADIFKSPRAGKPSRTLPDGFALNLSGSYCMDTRQREFFSSCHGNESPVSLDDEVDSNFRTDKFDYVIDSDFYSCTPGEQTNPFISPTSIFQDNLDNCPIFDNFPVSPFPPVTCLPPGADSCPLDLNEGVNYSHLYDSIRQDITDNKKLYQLSGWLYKAGEMAGDMWRYRWFTLCNTRVTYSENNFSPFPKNHFHLNSDTKGFSVDKLPSVVNLIRPPNPHFFRIMTPHRVYHLCATSEEERTIWMEVLSRVIALSFVLK